MSGYFAYSEARKERTFSRLAPSREPTTATLSANGWLPHVHTLEDPVRGSGESLREDLRAVLNAVRPEAVLRLEGVPARTIPDWRACVVVVPDGCAERRLLAVLTLHRLE